MDMGPLLDIGPLGFSYAGRAPLFRGLQLRIAPGEGVGLVGNNGVGKTTLLRLVSGVLADTPLRGALATSGGRLDRSRCGILIENPEVWPELRLDEYLSLFAGLQGGAASDRARLLAAFELDPRLPMRALSQGTLQKVQLVRCLQCSPELLLLDEPSAHLDPLAQVAFRSELVRHCARGGAFLFSSHWLEEVDAVSSRVLLLRDGVLQPLEARRGWELVASKGAPQAGSGGSAGSEEPAGLTAPSGTIRLSGPGDPAGQEAQDALRALLAGGATVSSFGAGPLRGLCAASAAATPEKMMPREPAPPREIAPNPSPFRLLVRHELRLILRDPRSWGPALAPVVLLCGAVAFLVRQVGGCLGSTELLLYLIPATMGARIWSVESWSGERDRRTLEPLLLMPLARAGVFRAKFTALLLLSVGLLGIAAAGMALALGGCREDLAPQLVAWLALLLLAREAGQILNTLRLGFRARSSRGTAQGALLGEFLLLAAIQAANQLGGAEWGVPLATAVPVGWMVLSAWRVRRQLPVAQLR